jgi:HEAT repeat protein
MASNDRYPLNDLLQSARFDAIAEMAASNKRLLSLLAAQTFQPDHLLAWRAVQAFGMAAQRIAEVDAEFVRGHLRRQFWLLSDESGGIGWRAPELIGETLARCPRAFEEFVSPLIYVLDLEGEDAPRFRAGTLWAIGCIAPGRPQAAQLALPLVLPCLEDADPQARGMALWCLGCLGYRDAIPGLAGLLADFSPVEIYTDGSLLETTVADLAKSRLAWL